MRPCLLAFSLLPAISFSVEPSVQSGDVQFSMITGQGVPVCEAYLDLLNRSPLERSPFCGRPESGLPGFAPLERRFLNADQISPLFTYVWEFMAFDNQLHVERYFYRNAEDPAKSRWSSSPVTKNNITEDLNGGLMFVWTYDSDIDIANDGHPLRVLLWQGYGATRWPAACGRANLYPWTNSYVKQRAFVLNSDGSMIDEQRTRAIFGSPKEATEGPHAGKSGEQSDLPVNATPFEPLADSIGIFGYQGKFYIQTENRPATKNAELPPVDVFLHQSGKTTLMCKFHPLIKPVPEDDPHN